MLNDREYIGRMLASDSQLFSMDVCDVASLEFSLRHLKDAKPWGRLQDGRITLRSPRRHYDRNRQRHQRFRRSTCWQWTVSGVGPLGKATAHGRKSIVPSSPPIAIKVKSGEMPATAGALAAIEKELERKPGPWVISSGAREPSKKEIVADE